LETDFPKRNYLLSGWSEKILIAEAGEKFGSMLTAALALELGREVLAVPNSIYSNGSVGTNSLIEFGQKTGLEEKIIDIVKEIPRTIDEIISSIKEDREGVFDAITNLELEGKLKTVAGCRIAEI
jgi:DNA processing protein